MGHTQPQFHLLKMQKKLKGKNVFIGYDVTPRVCIVRKELLGIFKCLVNKRVECWVPPILPCYFYKKYNTVAKVSWYNAKGLLILQLLYFG